MRKGKFSLQGQNDADAEEILLLLDAHLAAVAPGDGLRRLDADALAGMLAGQVNAADILAGRTGKGVVDGFEGILAFY